MWPIDSSCHFQANMSILCWHEITRSVSPSVRREALLMESNDWELPTPRLLIVRANLISKCTLINRFVWSSGAVPARDAGIDAISKKWIRQMFRGWRVGRLTLVTQQQEAGLRMLAPELDGDLVAPAAYHQTFQQDGLVSQHGRLPATQVFESDHISFNQAHVHNLDDARDEEERRRRGHG